MGRPRVRPDLAQLATTQFAETYVRQKFGAAADMLKDVLRLGDDLTALVTAASARRRSMMDLGRHRLPALGPEDLQIRMPRAPEVADALTPLVRPLLTLRDQVLRHDADGSVIPDLVTVRRLESSALRLHVVLITAACQAAKVKMLDVYDLVALSACTGGGSGGENSRPDVVKARLDRWRYALREAYNLRHALERENLPKTPTGRAI